MISTKDIFESAQLNDDIWSLQYLGKGLYLLAMVDDTAKDFSGKVPQKMNSYGVMSVIDEGRFNCEFAPRNFTKEFHSEAAVDAFEERVYYSES